MRTLQVMVADGMLQNIIYRYLLTPLSHVPKVDGVIPKIVQWIE